MRKLAIIGVPTSAGAHAPGQERAPEAFRRAGIVELLGRHGFIVDDRGDLPKVRWTPDQLNPRAQHFEQVADVAKEVDSAVLLACETSDAVLVLGGDCTIEVGVVSAFARRGERVGLVYFDAGFDLNVPSSVRLGFLDWMGTAHLLGLPEATEPLSHLGPKYPLIDPAQIVFVGAVPDELTDWERHLIDDKGLQVIWSDHVRSDPVSAAHEALRGVEEGVDRILVHFDLDVIDFLDFPAADFPTINAGITFADALSCIREFTRHPKFGALTICEFNPDHVDEDNLAVRCFVEGVIATMPHP
jgi:arginase